MNMVKKTKDKEVDLNELADWSGERSVRRFRFVVPVLKFNGSTDKWSLLTPDEEGNWIPEELKGDIEIVVLKVRRTLASYEKLPDGSGLRMFTNEHDSWKDNLTVFEMKKGDSKPRMVDIGTAKDLRQRWPKLKLRQNLYSLLGEKLVKFPVRGKSLSNLFSYYQEFKASEHIFQFWTKLGSHSETNEGGLTYYVVDWVRGSESELPVVAEKLREVKESLELQDKQYAELGAREEDTVLHETESEVEPPKPEEESEEIQVKDLPL